jgi:hypothetical protein
MIQCFEEGAFTVNITGERWHAVALDEAHEMCINKDLKQLLCAQQLPIFRIPPFSSTIALIKAYKHLICELFPERTKRCAHSNAILDNTKQASQRESNVLKMCSERKKHELLTTEMHENRGLLNAKRVLQNSLMIC